MEIDNLKNVPLEEMSGDFQADVQRMTKIFDRGVKRAKAENKRLAIISEESKSYPAPIPETPVVNDSDES